MHSLLTRKAVELFVAWAKFGVAAGLDKLQSTTEMAELVRSFGGLEKG